MITTIFSLIIIQLQLKYFLFFVKMKKQFYTVQKIVAKKVIDDKIYYQIKWLNYPSEQNTLEPIQHLQAVSAMVQEFQQNLLKNPPPQIKTREKREVLKKVKSQTEKKQEKPQQFKIPIKKIIRKRREKGDGSEDRNHFVIRLKSSQKPFTHWIFNNRVIKIKFMNKQEKFKVEWDNGDTSFCTFQQLAEREPERLASFFEKQLNLTHLSL